MYTHLSGFASESLKQRTSNIADAIRPMAKAVLQSERGLFFGKRFDDNEQVFQALCMNELKNESVAEQRAKDLENMNDLDFRSAVFLALKEAADADYFYEFEKEY